MPRHGPGVYKAKNGTWFFKVNVKAVDGRRIQTSRRGFATATDARRAKRQLLDELESQVSTDERSAISVRDLVEQYLDEAETLGRLAPKTLFDYRNYSTSYIYPHLGDRQASEVTPEIVADWQLILATSGSVKTGEPLSPGTIRLARAPLNGAFRYGIGRGLLGANPVLAVKPPPRRKSTPVAWTPEQARQFLAWQDGDRLLPLWSFMLASGLRIGELVRLEWSKVELDERRVRISRFVSTLGYEVVESSGKSREAKRTIDLDDHLVQLLLGQRGLQGEEQGVPGYEISDFVFTRPLGGEYHPQFLSKLLGQLSTEMGLPRLTAHGLRHTCATLMLGRGVPPKVAAERLGHADPTLFMNLYSHVSPSMQSEAASEIGDALFGGG